MRDLTFVDDVTEAFLLAAAEPRCHGRIFNVGGAPPVALAALAKMLVEVAGNGARYVVKNFPEDRAKIDIGSYYADDSAFRDATGWTPVTDVRTGLEKTLAWLRPRLEVYC